MDFKKIIILLFIIIAIILSQVYYEVNTTKFENIVLKTKKIPKDKKFKILQISDLHNRKLPNNNKNLLKEIKKQNTDIIVLTGDIIDGKTDNFDNVYSLLEDLVKINSNIYFVSGNHEWRNRKTKDFLEGIRKRKIKVINNSNELFTKDDFSINICGVDDPYSNHDNINKAFKNIDRTNFTLLLSHAPDIVFKYINLPCNLILSGHTHGGQVRFPFIGGIIAPGQGYFPKYDKGLFKLDHGLSLYIDSGLGTSTLPIRFLNRSQVSFITLIGE